MSEVHNSTENGAPESSDLLVAKILAMTVLGLASFFVGVLPIKLAKRINIKSANEDKNLLISLFLCFGGGVLLFTTFLHLQPEVRESFARLEGANKIPIIGHGISLSEIVFCSGFFFVYLIEELVHVLLDRRLENQALHRTLSVRKKDNVHIPRVALNKDDVVGNVGSNKPEVGKMEVQYHHVGVELVTSKTKMLLIFIYIGTFAIVTPLG